MYCYRKVKSKAVGGSPWLVIILVVRTVEVLLSYLLGVPHSRIGCYYHHSVHAATPITIIFPEERQAYRALAVFFPRYIYVYRSANSVGSR